MPSRGRAGKDCASWRASGDVGLRVGLHLVAGRARVEVAAGRAGAQPLAAVEGLEHAEEVLLDVLEVEELLVELAVAALAEPHQPVVLMRQAAALDDQADGAFGALRRMRHPRRQ